MEVLKHLLLDRTVSMIMGYFEKISEVVYRLIVPVKALCCMGMPGRHID